MNPTLWIALVLGAGEYHLDDYLPASNNAGTALIAAQQACRTDAGTDYIPSCTIHVSGTYTSTTPYYLCSGVRLVGTGTGENLLGTVLQAHETDGLVVVPPSHPCPFDAGTVRVQPNVTLEHVGVRAIGSTSFSNGPVWGLKVAGGVVKMYDVGIRRFTVNAQFDCSTDDPLGAANCNLSTFRDVTLDQARHAGLIIGGVGGGRDANAMYSGRLSVPVNCQDAATWNDYFHARSYFCTDNPTDEACSATYRCAGVIDESGLGNTHVAIHGAHNRDLTTGIEYPNHVFRGGSNRSVCLGCYGEEGDPQGILSPFANAIGGHARFVTDRGHRLIGPRTYSLEIINDLDATNLTRLRLGFLTSTGGTYFLLDRWWPGVNQWGPWGLRWKFEQNPGDDYGRWFWDLGNGGTRPLQVESQRPGFVAPGAELTLPGLVF